MKVGDKVICIEDYKVGDKLVYEKGKLYEIITIYQSINDDSPEITIKYYHISADMVKSIGFSKRFYKYFISLKEERKQKLEKINESTL